MPSRRVVQLVGKKLDEFTHSLYRFTKESTAHEVRLYYSHLHSQWVAQVDPPRVSEFTIAAGVSEGDIPEHRRYGVRAMGKTPDLALDALAEALSERLHQG